MNNILGVVGLIWIFILFCRLIIWLEKETKYDQKANSGDYFIDKNTAVLSFEKDSLKEVIYGPKFIKMDHKRMRTFNLNLIYVSLSSYKIKSISIFELR